MSPARLISGLVLPALAGTGLLLSGAAAAAQTAPPEVSPPAPAHVAYVDGAAFVERDGEAHTAAVNAVVVPGDRLRTDAGRMEVLFGDGTALDLDEQTVIEMESPTLMRLEAGRAILVVVAASGDTYPVPYEIDTPVSTIVTSGEGRYRADAASATAPPRADAFARWSDQLEAARTARAASDEYLPSDLQAYGGTFDRYGSWQDVQPYGYVWYPSVAPDWRPYYYGYWSALPSYGWTWTGVDAWAWPTHHYGRWGFARGAWFWIPGARWSSAWVSWGAAPDYVSWCPLGFDNRPVFALSIGVRTGHRGWTIVPRRSFGYRGAYAHRYAVDAYRIPRSTPFIQQRIAPVARRQARIIGAHQSAPARRIGTAIPRSRSASGRARGLGSPAAGVRASRTALPPPGYVAPMSRPAVTPGVRTPRRGGGVPSAGWAVPRGSRNSAAPLSAPGTVTPMTRPPVAAPLAPRPAQPWRAQPRPSVSRPARAPGASIAPRAPVRATAAPRSAPAHAADARRAAPGRGMAAPRSAPARTGARSGSARAAGGHHRR